MTPFPRVGTLCKDFTVSECSIDPATIIAQDDRFNPEECQKWCSHDSGCILFRHDGTTCYKVVLSYFPQT